MKTKVKIIDHFDVWGNEEEGYEVNDSIQIAERLIDDAILDDDIRLIDWLIKLKILHPCAKGKVKVDQSFDMIEILCKDNGKPLYTLLLRI
jgi:hypothetical protein